MTAREPVTPENNPVVAFLEAGYGDRYAFHGPHRPAEIRAHVDGMFLAKLDHWDDESDCVICLNRLYEWGFRWSPQRSEDALEAVFA